MLGDRVRRACLVWIAVASPTVSRADSSLFSDETWRYSSTGSLAIDGGIDIGFSAALPTGLARGVGAGVTWGRVLAVGASKQELAVTYYVERDRYDPYEIVVVGDPRREEVSRVTLRGPEIHQIPGTFGDPFRVVQTLPGVSSVVSLLPFPIVRGASPSSTR